MAELATESKQPGQPLMPAAMLDELERRRAGLARHMARAVVTLVRWDDSTGRPPRREAIARACAAGLDLFLATAREARPATQRELREVAQLGILQARGSQSVEPVLAAYRIAARVAWDAIMRAWRDHPQATPEAMVITANYVFSALDHLARGTRARTRLFHGLVSDTFDSELALQKQALALNLPIAGGYVAVVCKVDRGADALPEVAGQLDLPPRALAHTTDPVTLVVLWPADSAAAAGPAAEVVGQLQEALDVRLGGAGRSRVRGGVGSFHGGLRGVSRSYLEALQAVEAGRKVRPEELALHHDEVAPYLVLAQNPLTIERYVDHVLGPLLADERGHDVLLQTIGEGGRRRSAPAPAHGALPPGQDQGAAGQ